LVAFGNKEMIKKTLFRTIVIGVGTTEMGFSVRESFPSTPNTTWPSDCLMEFVAKEWGRGWRVQWGGVSI
jgi:hypothetical protein